MSFERVQLGERLTTGFANVLTSVGVDHHVIIQFGSNFECLFAVSNRTFIGPVVAVKAHMLVQVRLEFETSAAEFAHKGASIGVGVQMVAKIPP